MPTEIPSSIQNPACSWRERTNSERRTSSGSPIGTNQREPTIASKRARASSTIATTEELRASRGPGRARLERQHAPAPAVRVDDVDRVVLAVGARDAEEERQPPPEPEPAFGGELAPEDESRPDLVEVAARVLLDAVHEHVEGRGDAFGQIHLTCRFHALYDAIRCAPCSPCHSRHEPDGTPARAGGDGGQWRIPARRAALAERAPSPRLVHLRLDLHRRDLHRGRGGADRIHHQVPA